jgi:hypothetical protein
MLVVCGENRAQCVGKLTDQMQTRELCSRIEYQVLLRGDNQPKRFDGGQLQSSKFGK